MMLFGAKNQILFWSGLFALTCQLLAFAPAEASEMEKPQFKLAWTVYAGFMPWSYAEKSGIIDKWAERYGIEIDVVQFNDYHESLHQFREGHYQAIAASSIDLMMAIAAEGVDTTAVIVGGYSDGSDAVILRDADRLEDLKGRKVGLVEDTVSDFLLARALEKAELDWTDIHTVGTSDLFIEALYYNKKIDAVVAWNPYAFDILQEEDANEVFSSADIPGEILDLTAVQTQTLERHPEFGQALACAWFETMAVMNSDAFEGISARRQMASESGADLLAYEAQLADTKIFYTPNEAIDFVRSQDFLPRLKRVREQMIEDDLLHASRKPVVSIVTPAGGVPGEASDAVLRFVNTYMQCAEKEQM